MTSRNQWSKILPPRLAPTDITILVLLLLVGAIGNYFFLNLPLGVQLLFGGIAVWTIVILYGTYWGTLAALITSLVTIRLWGHPYAVIIFTLEVFFVASLWHSRRRSLLLLEGIYWLCLGMPLIGLFYAGVIQLPLLQVGLILLKQPINGIFNVLIANLIVFFLPIHYWTRRSRQLSSVSFRQILFNLLFVLAIIPLLPLISLEGYLAFDEIENRVDRDLTAISTAVKTEMHREQHERLADLQKLAQVAQTTRLQQSAQLQQSTEILQKNRPVWQQLYVTNSEGKIIASSPPFNTSNGANAIELAACNFNEQFTFVPATEVLQIKFPVFMVGENSQGCVVGDIDQNYLRQLLLANRSQSELSFSLVDSRGRVVVSTDEPKEEIAPQTDSTSINNSFFNSTIEHRLPIKNNMPLMVRWQNSFFLQRQSLDWDLPLTLVIETPAAPYIKFLQEMYVFALVKILSIALLALFFSYLLSRQLVNPLSSLRIVTSDLPNKLSENKHISWPRSRIAEVESLALNFQLMAEILQGKFQELQTINTTLEQRIENRTQELFKTNQDLQAEIAERKQTETSLRETTRTLEKFSANLQQLHRIGTTKYDSLEELFADCLETGRDILALTTGMVGQISDRSYIICSVLSDLTCLKPGLAFSLEEAYCKAVVESQKTITYDRVSAIASMQNHPLYQQLKIESYISAPIFINGKVYGTLCFCSTQVRSKNFDAREREMVELMAKTIGWYIAEHQLLENLEKLVAERTFELSKTNERLQRELIERQRVEKALRESETRLVIAQRIASIGSWKFDLENQKIAWSEQTFYHWELAPTDPEPTYAELLQKVHSDDREILQQSVERAIAEGIPYTLDLRILRSDGSIGYLDSRGEPILNEQGRTIKLIGTSLDITDRKRIEEALRQREEQLRLITDSLPVCISYIDRDLRYRFANKTYETWFGYPSEEIYGKPIVEVIGEAAYELAKDQIERVLSGEPVTYEAELPYRQGGIRYVNAILVPDISSNEGVRGYYALISDITECKQAENQLRLARNRLSHLLTASPAIIYSCQPTDVYWTTFISDNVISILGYESRQFTETADFWANHLHLEDKPRTFADMSQIFERKHLIVEYRFQHQDGTYRWIRDEMKMVYDEHGEALELVGCMIDISDRKQAEEALKASEERFKAQYRSIPLPTYTWQQQGEEWMLIEYNRAAEIYTQGKLCQILGKTANELYSDMPEVLADFSQCLNERTSIKREMHYQMRSTGEWKDLIVNYAFVPPDMVTVHTEDITALKQTQEKLKAKNAEMEAIFEAFPDIFFYIAADGTILDYKAQMTSELYLQPEFLRGKPMREVLPSPVREQCEEMITRVLQTNSLASFEYTLPLINAEEYYEARLVPLQPDRVIAIVRNISDRKRVENKRQQAEQALRRSENQLRLIADALPILIAYMDSQQRYIFTNQAYEEWFGQTPGGLKRLHLQTVMGLSLYQQVREYVDIVLSGKRVDFEIEVPAEDGSYHCFSATHIPHIVEHGEVKGFFVSLVDITERKAVERMKEEFISVVSHELRTPLTAIHGSLKLLATGRLGQLSEQGLQMLNIADESCDRLVRLINDILDFQRMNSGKITLRQKNCDAGELLVKAVEAMQEIARQQNITFSSEPASIYVWIDPDYILQTLTNLISNAIKFSDPGTTIWLQVTEEHGDRVLFQVRDEGRGIPPNKLESIFERFHQIDASDSRQKGGTGLGLAICRQIIELHGGKIWAESTLGQGSTFYFTLPKIKG
ncbi:PAS domain S-box protein [Pleurocapsales cyanobacterium LEGE 06147]|nr:PAS domain S-box protein [Pleurocapsales cyanobacterium LEGE 06147]